MRHARFLIAVFALVSLLVSVGWQDATPPAKLDEASLKALLIGLGYEIKEAGTGIYEVPITSAGLNIPTRIFLSKSQTKIWLSVALLTADGTAKLSREDLQALLEKNVEIGPCHFMIEKGWLKMKMAVDNRSVTPATLRTELEYLTARVGDSKAVWQKK